MKKITEKEFKTLYRNIDNIIKLDDLKKEIYLEEYSLYMNLLINYLINKTDIKKYDDMLNNDSHNFIPVPFEKMDIYQRLASDNLKYFYLRNNLYLERLDEVEKEYLDRKIKNNDYTFDVEASNFIENTYQKVILEMINSDPKIVGLINYGPVAYSTLASNDNLVIGVRYDEFNLNGMSDNDWDLNYQEQTKILNNIIEKLEESITNNLNKKTKIIKYNDFCTIKIKEN